MKTWLALLCLLPALAQTRPTLDVPLLAAPPRLEDYLSFPEVSPLARAQGFLQQFPKDGEPATQSTQVLLGYDRANLYLVWLCRDSEPTRLRANISRRENIFDDDYVQVKLDTFADQRHAIVFSSNPHGIQADGLLNEGDTTLDTSWDGVWSTRAAIIPQGYVVLMTIPFRTLRFAPTPNQEWGITLLRVLGRSGERSFWPRVSSRLHGELNQAARLTGLRDIQPGRNLQFNPYLSTRSYRALDTRNPAQPRFASSPADIQAGFDAKAVLRQSLVLDFTLRPDFSQVESDDPQNAVNQRFALYYPEKRPFFLENANYFESAQGQYQLTPLVFTRNIAAPDFGLKLTGKLGPWALGLLAAADRSPGESVAPGDPLAGRRAGYFLAQATHDLGAQSSIGALFTAREFAGAYNRVGGALLNLRLNPNWTTRLRAAYSTTRDSSNSSPYNGLDAEAQLSGSGRRFSSLSLYQDISPNFRTATGFLQRAGIRRFAENYHFYWRPARGPLLSWGPEVSLELLYAPDGLPLRYSYTLDPVFVFRRNTYIAPILSTSSDTLRPQDAPVLSNSKFIQNKAGFVFGTLPIRLLSWRTLLQHGGAINLVPPTGARPTSATETSLVQNLTLHPAQRLQIDNMYILDTLHTREAAVFTNHILQSKWNFQLTRELSFRFIGRYNQLLASPTASSLKTTRSMNYDFLLTYLLHPGTALYLGYNSNLENLLPGLCDAPCNGLPRSPNGYINSGRQVFLKISYLFQR